MSSDLGKQEELKAHEYEGAHRLFVADGLSVCVAGCVLWSGFPRRLLLI